MVLAIAGFALIAQPWFPAQVWSLLAYLVFLHAFGLRHLYWHRLFKKKPVAGPTAKPVAYAIPTMDQIPEHAVVKLLVDLPIAGISAGESGTVVAIYSNGKSYEVEFVGSSVFESRLVTCERDELVVIRADEDEFADD